MRKGVVRPPALDLVVIEAVVIVPEARAAERVHRVGDFATKCSKNFEANVFVAGVVFGQLQRHGEHRAAVKGHPGRAIGLLEVGRRRERPRTISNRPMLSSPRNPPAKRCLPSTVLAVDPPGEVDQQLVEHAGQKLPVAAAFSPVIL